MRRREFIAFLGGVAWNNLPQEFEQLWRYILVQSRCAGGVVAGMGKACDQTSSDRVIHNHHDDGYGWIEALRRPSTCGGVRQDHARL